MNTTQQVISETFAREADRILASLIGTVRDFELAEDALQDALLVALERWPVDGIPRNPGAWMMATARHKAIDRLLALQRPCPEASFWQALCHVREGRVDQAVEALREARVSPNGADAGRQARGTDERTPAPPPATAA